MKYILVSLLAVPLDNIEMTCCILYWFPCFGSFFLGRCIFLKPTACIATVGKCKFFMMDKLCRLSRHGQGKILKFWKIVSQDIQHSLQITVFWIPILYDHNLNVFFSFYFQYVTNPGQTPVKQITIPSFQTHLSQRERVE